jgi:hypothetical protein
LRLSKTKPGAAAHQDFRLVFIHVLNFLPRFLAADRFPRNEKVMQTLR